MLPLIALRCLPKKLLSAPTPSICLLISPDTEATICVGSVLKILLKSFFVHLTYLCQVLKIIFLTNLTRHSNVQLSHFIMLICLLCFFKSPE